MANDTLIIPTRKQIPSTVDIEDGRLWYKHPNPNQVLGFGIICERCGLPFKMNQNLEISDEPPGIRHFGCNGDRHITITHFAIIKILRIVEIKAWYEKYRGLRLSAFIRTDGIAEPSLLPEYQHDVDPKISRYITYNNSISTLRLCVFPNDFSVIDGTVMEITQPAQQKRMVQ